LPDEVQVLKPESNENSSTWANIGIPRGPEKRTTWERLDDERGDRAFKGDLKCGMFLSQGRKGTSHVTIKYK